MKPDVAETPDYASFERDARAIALQPSLGASTSVLDPTASHAAATDAATTIERPFLMQRASTVAVFVRGSSHRPSKSRASAFARQAGLAAAARQGGIASGVARGHSRSH
jgi:hypothetical protein